MSAAGNKRNIQESKPRPKPYALTHTLYLPSRADVSISSCGSRWKCHDGAMEPAVWQYPSWAQPEDWRLLPRGGALRKLLTFQSLSFPSISRNTCTSLLECTHPRSTDRFLGWGMDAQPFRNAGLLQKERLCLLVCGALALKVKGAEIFFFFGFLGLHPWHMEVPRLGGQIGAAAASLPHSHINATSQPLL